MALIVEDGTGKPLAQSLCSVADADVYHTSRGNTAWLDVDTDIKEQALVRATDYIEGTYRFAGYRYTRTQALSWPRWEVERADFGSGYYARWIDFLGYDTVPERVRWAVAELADRARSGPLAPDVAGGAMKSRTKVGPLEVEYSAASLTRAPQYPIVDNMLRPFLGAGSKYSAPVRRA